MLQLNGYKTYPGLDEKSSYMLDNLHDDEDILTKNKKINQTYEQIKKEEDYNAYQKERADYINKVVAESSTTAKTKEQKASIELAKRTTELASNIRGLAYQQGLDYKKNSDDEAMVKFIKAYPDAKDKMKAYLNGDDGLIDYINEIRKPTGMYGKGGAGKVDNFLMGMGQESMQFGVKAVAGIADFVGLKKVHDKIMDFAQFADEKDKETLSRIGIDTMSDAFAAGKTTTDVALSTAPMLLVPAPQALGLASNIKNPVLKFMTKSLINGVEGMVGMETYAMGAEGRKATGGELAFGGIGGAALPLAVGAGGKVISKLKGVPATAESIAAKAENVAGKVFQETDPYAIQQGMKTLEELDTSAINTYDDFTAQLDNSKKGVMTQKKTLLDPIKDNAVKYDDLVLEKQAKMTDGTTQNVQMRPFDNAMEDIKLLYEKEGDFANYRKIEYLQNRMNQGKMTMNEMDDFIVEYGQKEKAFSDKTGQPLTSTTNIARENMRGAMKDIFRNLGENMGVKGLKEVDQKFHQYSVTQRMVEKVAESVQKLQNKIKERNVVQFLVDKGVKLINTLTGGGLKQVFASVVPSNVGNKVMNSLDLQENLPRFLKKLDALLEDAGKIKTKAQADKLILDMKKAGIVEEAVPEKVDNELLTPEQVNNLKVQEQFGVTVPEQSFNKADLSATPKAEITKASTEADIIKYATENTDYLKQQYKKVVDNYTEDGALILNTDDVRPFLGEKLRVESSVNHEGASIVSKALKKELMETMPEGTKVLILGGGGGSGKGFTLKDIIKPRGYGWVEDKTFSKISNIKDYKELVEKGFKPEIKFVYSPQDMAWNNALDRFLTKELRGDVGRKLPFEPFSEAHKGVIKNIGQLMKENIPFEVYVNKGKGKGTPELIDNKDIFKYVEKYKDLTKEEAKTMAQKFRIDGKGLSKEQVSALFGLLVLIGINGTD